MQIIIKFKKKGLLRFLSAIELSNALIRTLNRCGLKMEYSEGFHPSPKVSFLDSTPTGMIDLAMYVTVKLKKDLEELQEIEILNKIKEFSPKGIEPVKIFKSDFNLNKIVNEYEYILFSNKEIDFSKSVSKHSGKSFVPIEIMRNLEVILKRNNFMVKYTVDRENLFNPFLLEGVFLAIRKRALVDGEDVSKIMEGTKI